MTGLGDLGDRVHGFAAAFDGQQIWRRGRVAIPEVVMNELIMPETFAGGGVEGEQAVGEKILSKAIAAPEIKRRRTGGNEHDAAFVIQCHARPTIRAATKFPSIGRPSLVTHLAGMRDGVKGPRLFAGADVIGADVSGRRWTGRFRNLASP